MIDNKYLQFIRKENGAIAVEMAFVIIGFVLLLTVIVDFGVVMLRHSKLERVSASAASVFREREALYSENQALTKFVSEVIDQGQVDKLGLLTKKLMGESDVAIRVDAIYFASGVTKAIDSSQTFYSGVLPSSPSNPSGQCGPNIAPLENFIHLSPYSGLDRWMPLYRVTVCISGRVSLYKFITNNGGNEKTVDGLMSSNITLPR